MVGTAPAAEMFDGRWTAESAKVAGTVFATAAHEPDADSSRSRVQQAWSDQGLAAEVDSWAGAERACWM